MEIRQMGKEAILVTAAAGKTGLNTVQQLRAQGHGVRALVHQDDARAEALRNLGATVVVGDLLDHDDVQHATAGIEAAYFCYPIRPGLIQATAYFAEAAKNAGVRAIVNMSQISARRDSESHAARDHWIAERVLDWSGVAVTHLRPTFFAQWLTYPFQRASFEQGVIDLPYGTGRHAPIAAEDQARLIAAILTAPREHAGKTYTLHGPVEMDEAGIAAAAGAALGRTIVYRPATLEEYRRRLEANGLPEFLVQHLCAVAVDCQNGIFAGEDTIIAKATGKAPMTVQDFVSLHREAFQTKTAASAGAH
jgi:NAD(P)H dehydrogenase (quinone)